LEFFGIRLRVFLKNPKIFFKNVSKQGRIKVLGGPWQSVRGSPPKIEDEQKRRIIAIGNFTTQAKNLQKN
jgi:hypothetical protein